jgi:hypothetical protein
VRVVWSISLVRTAWNEFEHSSSTCSSSVFTPNPSAHTADSEPNIVALIFNETVYWCACLQMYGGWNSKEDQARYRTQRRLSAPSAKPVKNAAEDNTPGIGPYDLFKAETAAGQQEVPHYGGDFKHKDTQVCTASLLFCLHPSAFPLFFGTMIILADPFLSTCRLVGWFAFAVFSNGRRWYSWNG